MEQKKLWREWDEFLVDAWMKEGWMWIVVEQFFAIHNINVSAQKLSDAHLQNLFLGLGISSRSPKVKGQLHLPVRAFFQKFFPTVGNLLWDGNIERVLLEIRKYKVGLESGADRELSRCKRSLRRCKSTPELPLIPGTNAMHVSDARRSMSDWGTVKPPARQRRMRL